MNKVGVSYISSIWIQWTMIWALKLSPPPPPTPTYIAHAPYPALSFLTPLACSHPPPLSAHHGACILPRDLTINSLFYNINTGTVEDYTGKGTSDLRLGLVRTPLPPCETLLDDPLRILRAIRFASRLGFRVDPELVGAGRDPRVHQALGNKVCRCLCVCVSACLFLCVFPCLRVVCGTAYVYGG